MDTIEPPSFSLGFDIDPPSDSQPSSHQNPSRLTGDGGDVEPEPLLTISDSDDFYDAFASTRSRFSSCSSKSPPLHGSVEFANQLSTSRGKRKHFDVLPSAGSGISSVASLFQRTTRSPLRMFQLLDSDSEEDHLFTRRATKTDYTSSKDRLYGSMPCSGDMWKGFSPAAMSKIQTPALDDVCQDYFSSIKTSSNTARKQRSGVASSSNSGFDNFVGFQKTKQFLDSSHPSPPSHLFFLHTDPRIQNLVRQRLPNFLPLGIVNDRDSRQEVFLIDYMNQFSSNGSTKTGESSSTSKSYRRGKQTKSKVSKVQQESAHASKGWLNPKARSATPKDAGKRRVSANSGSVGHWFTSPEGRKVYISKSGQEFSGQSAYRCYKNETGGGFKKSKTKQQPKMKTKN
ncbi:unnamed protein product [Cochlearia groenlandica]